MASETEMYASSSSGPEVVTMPVATDKEKGNGSLCRNCGVSGPVKSSRCFAGEDKEHRFYFPGEKDDTKDDEKPQKPVRTFWKVLFILIMLTLYGVSIAYIVKPIQKYLDQDVATSVTILTVKPESPVPFPALQVCNFRFGTNFKSFNVYYIKENKTDVADFNYTIVPIGSDDYGYEFSCYEINNIAPDKSLQVSSKKQRVVLVISVPKVIGYEVTNTDCYPFLCDPDLPDNATIIDISPLDDAQGISISAFAPDGVPRTSVLDDVTYVNSGSYTAVSVSYTKTFRFEQEDKPEQSYKMGTSAVRYAPGTYAINFTGDGDSFQMDDVVFAEIFFGELSYTQINETKPYEAFNAFGDATAIMGFFTGFGVFGGPTFLSLIMDNSRHPFWSNIFYG